MFFITSEDRRRKERQEKIRIKAELDDIKRIKKEKKRQKKEEQQKQIEEYKKLMETAFDIKTFKFLDI